MELLWRPALPADQNCPRCHRHLHFKRFRRGAVGDIGLFLFRSHHQSQTNIVLIPPCVVEEGTSCFTFYPPAIPPPPSCFWVADICTDGQIKYLAEISFKTGDLLWCGKSSHFTKEALWPFVDSFSVKGSFLFSIVNKMSERKMQKFISTQHTRKSIIHLCAVVPAENIQQNLLYVW